METTTQTLDTRGLQCPLPIIKTRKTLDTMNAGETLLVITSDPGSVKDVSAFCRQTGNDLMSSWEKNNQQHFIVRKS